MTDQERTQLALEIGLIRSVLNDFIALVAQSAVGVISVKEAEELLNKLDLIRQTKP